MLYTFEDFVLDTRRCELKSAGEPLHLEPQVYAVLCHLIENRDRLVRKEELLDAIWGHRFVTPATLNSRIRSLRQALRDDGSAQRIVRTVRGVGFRFATPVREGGVEPAAVGAPGSPGPSPVTPPPGDAAELRSASAARRSGPGSAAEGPGDAVEQHIRFCRASDGGRIAYATSGTGPPLVKPANWLTHVELDWESPVWRHWLRELSRDHTLIRYDERGCGLSDRTAEEVSLEAWVRDLERVMDELKLERVPLVALSQGCAVAVTYAARHPERVSRLVLYGGYALGRFRRSSPDERERSSAMLRMLPLGWGCDNQAFRQFFGHVFLPEGTPEQISWFSDLQRMSATADMAVRLWLACADIDVREIAARVRVPTLVVHGTGDAVVPFEQGRILAGLIPGARLVPLQTNNHVLLDHEPAWPRFLEEVRAFLAEDQTAGPPANAEEQAATRLPGGERAIRAVR